MPPSRFRAFEAPPFVFLGSRLWLDFVNTAAAPDGSDALQDFPTFVRWLRAARQLDDERAGAMLRRAEQQPAGAGATLGDARRVRAVLRTLAERGAGDDETQRSALAEINRVLGRSAGTRRVDARHDGSFVRSFVLVGDAFAGLLVPIVESAADALVLEELPRVRKCGAPQCPRVFLDTTKNARRRWCDMSTCGNRAKAARFRRKAGGNRP